MKNRKPYVCDNDNIYTLAVGAMNSTYKGVPTKKPTLESLSSSVKVRYLEYDNKFNNNDLLTISNSNRNNTEKEALIYLYEGRSNTVSDLKNSIKLNQDVHLRQICPNCGLLPAVTVDHYIPKEIHPDFSIYSKNLIWSCGTCNGKKSTYWKEPTHRGIINFYDDDIPNFNYLDCKIENNNGILKANFTLNYEKLRDYPVIKSHYERLEILNLYKDHIPTKLAEMASDLSTYKGELSSEGVKRILIKQYFKRIREFGKNDWKAALLRAVIIGKYYNLYLT